MKRIALLVVAGLLLGATVAHATSGRPNRASQAPAASAPVTFQTGSSTAPATSGADDPAGHDVGDDNGVDDPATHDVGDDNGGDDRSGHAAGDDHGGNSGRSDNSGRTDHSGPSDHSGSSHDGGGDGDGGPGQD